MITSRYNRQISDDLFNAYADRYREETVIIAEDNVCCDGFLGAHKQLLISGNRVSFTPASCIAAPRIAVMATDIFIGRTLYEEKQQATQIYAPDAFSLMANHLVIDASTTLLDATNKVAGTIICRRLTIIVPDEYGVNPHPNITSSIEKIKEWILRETQEAIIDGMYEKEDGTFEAISLQPRGENTDVEEVTLDQYLSNLL